MRSRLSSDLIVLVLAIAACRSVAVAGPVKMKPKAAPARQQAQAIWTREAKGFGGTEAEARQNAVESLREDVKAWLRNHRPEITYLPSMAEVEGMVRDFSPATPWESARKDELRDLDHEHLLEVTARLELTNNDLADFQQQTLREAAQRRQVIMGKGLLGAIGLLVVASGYLRLEEKVGKHKGKLGLAAVGILGLVGLALLVIN